MRVFISYRRDDSAGFAGRLCDQLGGYFGAQGVFRDVVDIAPGADFVHAIDDAVSSCDVLVAVVGAHWLDVRDAAGRRRLDHPGDYVRRELAAALSRGIRVIPALIERASMPAEIDLPDELRPFARRNAIELRDSAWAQDTQRLVQIIESGSDRSIAPRTLSPRARRLIGVAVAIAAVGAVGAGWLAFRPSLAPPTSSGGASSGPPAGSAGGERRSPSQPIALPAQVSTTFREAGGDKATYEIRAVTLEGAASREPMLVLSIRMTNNTSYPLNFWDESFRLLTDGAARAPVGGLNEVVPARTVQDALVVFPAPGAGQNIVLRISALGKSSDIELGDLRPAAAGTKPE
jgi:hypothetical protein